MMKRSPRSPLLSDNDAQETGRKAERKTARRLGAALHAASGAVGKRADMSDLRHCIENKTTQKASIRVEYDWLLGVTDAAREQGKEPVLSVQFTSGSGQPRPRGRWVMVREDYWHDLQQERG